jgi:hypothetical protein
LPEITGLMAAVEIGQDRFSSGIHEAPPSVRTVLAREVGRVTIIPRSS